MAVSSSTQLGCGRDIDDVWANVDRPPTAHEQECPFCGPARASLQELERATADLRAADDVDPELQPGPLVVDRILEVARSEARRSRRLPLSKPVAGEVTADLTVSEQAVAAVVRRTGDALGGLQVRRCSVEVVEEPAPDPGTSTDISTEAARVPSDVRVSLRISIGPGVSIPLLSEEVRRAVVAVVEREVGMNVIGVDIVVEDVHGV
ncbi:hypothetical protein SAMN04488544_1622 [Microlunatus sagamiharensis]|uniref:Asp23 family, cell envelope-related function n=1 Tax=Microlunatus sagamiharensis TaxID=546874 RepID=A0A1H2M938_9ACTN|nr:hypothetical protein [Microlunatus sagamiharensis]SDU89733.1 hypothetical protein SAMN04488544_1622 [Microlunatus sagamiharensis]